MNPTGDAAQVNCLSLSLSRLLSSLTRPPSAAYSTSSLDGRQWGRKRSLYGPLTSLHPTQPPTRCCSCCCKLLCFTFLLAFFISCYSLRCRYDDVDGALTSFFSLSLAPSYVANGNGKRRGERKNRSNSCCCSYSTALHESDSAPQFNGRQRRPFVLFSPKVPTLVQFAKQFFFF